MTINPIQSKRASQSASLTGTVVLDSVPINDNALIFVYRESSGTSIIELPSGFNWVTGSPFGPAGRVSGIAYKEANNESNTFVVTSNEANTKTIIMREVNGLELTGILHSESENELNITSKIVGVTGGLTTPNNYAICSMNLSGVSGGSNTIDQGFQLLETTDLTSDAFLAAELITDNMDSLSPIYTWLTARAAMGQIAVFQNSLHR